MTGGLQTSSVLNKSSGLKTWTRIESDPEVLVCMDVFDFLEKRVVVVGGVGSWDYASTQREYL